ncbi:MAG: Universal stress protein UspA [Myxococcaceae bacterium]|nr:Universal stress protein UspA [Myxococcaceae bacterium]
MSNMDPLDLPQVNRPDWPRHAPGAYPILVCVQFDETGHNALTLAMRFAEAHKHAPLQVAHVVPDTNTSGRAAISARHTDELEAATKQLGEFVAARVGERPIDVTLHVRMGDVVETVFQLALDYDVELIVVGTHGRTGVRRLALGSVAQKLVEAARCPVLVAAPRDFSGMEQTLKPDPPMP